MDFSKGWKSKLILFIAIIVLISIGFIIGLVFSQGLKLEGGLSFDGAASLLLGLVAVFAATIILPIMIQPLFRRQKSISDITHENIKLIMTSIDEVMNVLAELNTSGNLVDDRDRKNLLALYSRIANYCAILSRHSGEISALSGFANDIEAPITQSKSNFAEVVVPGSIIDDNLYLMIKETLDSAIYKLVEIRYQIQ